VVGALHSVLVFLDHRVRMDRVRLVGWSTGAPDPATWATGAPMIGPNVNPDTARWVGDIGPVPWLVWAGAVVWCLMIRGRR